MALQSTDWTQTTAATAYDTATGRRKKDKKKKEKE